MTDESPTRRLVKGAAPLIVGLGIVGGLYIYSTSEFNKDYSAAREAFKKASGEDNAFTINEAQSLLDSIGIEYRLNEREIPTYEVRRTALGGRINITVNDRNIGEVSRERLKEYIARD